MLAGPSATEPIETAGVHRLVAGHQAVPVVAALDIDHDSRLRSRQISPRSVEEALAGGSSPHTTSTSASAGTTASPARSNATRIGPLLQAADRHDPPAHKDLRWPEQPELDGPDVP